MRLPWLPAIIVLVGAMMALTPYVLRAEPTWKAAAWLVMVVATVIGVAVFIRVELLLRRTERTANSDNPDT
ncbi:hypothetical protein [Streptomyces sp. NPDC048155]|uniref:hypothetical protein n=1 Tax=Streptomyces sp. NPDC048155 TaxID=3154818 RepID=UPI0033D85AE3